MSKTPKGPIGWARHYASLRQKGEHPLLTAQEARGLVDELGIQLYWAQDAHAYVGEMCEVLEKAQRVPEGEAMLRTEDVREWLKGPRCARMRAVDASLVSDTRPEEDAEQLTQALVALVRSALERSGRSQASVAEEIHVSVKHLNRMLQGHSQLTLWWAARILRVCGMRLVVGEDGQA